MPFYNDKDPEHSNSQSTRDGFTYGNDQRVVFYGRNLDEYCRMFDMAPEDLIGKMVLDCPGAEASFNAEATALGARIISLDILYTKPKSELVEIAKADIVDTIRASFAKSHLLTVSTPNKEQELLERRMTILSRWQEDFGSAKLPSRYVAGDVLKLPFVDDAFDLTLVGHLLFCYGDRLDLDFHRRALKELTRVTKNEVRIYPIRGFMGVGEEMDIYPQLDLLREELAKEGIHTEIRPSQLEVIKSWKEMLVLKKI